MRQRNHHRPLAEGLAHALLERSRTEEARDRHLADQDHHPRVEQLQLRVEPVRAVGDPFRRRRQVAGVRPVAAGEAPHQGGDVGQAAKLFGVAKARAQHPPVELLARAARERASRLALRGSGRLADDEKGRAPAAFERRVGLGDDPLVGADPARAALRLQLEERFPCQMTLTSRALGAALGMRPRFVFGLPSISLMSAVIAIGGAELIAMPTPYEWIGHFAASNSPIRAASSPPETKMPTCSNPARSSRARTSFTRSTVTPPRSPGVSRRTPRSRLPSASSASSLSVSTSTMRRTSSPIASSNATAALTVSPNSRIIACGIVPDAPSRPASWAPNGVAQPAQPPTTAEYSNVGAISGWTWRAPKLMTRLPFAASTISRAAVAHPEQLESIPSSAVS